MVLLVVCTIIIYEARKNPRRADRVVPAYAWGQISRAKRLGLVGDAKLVSRKKILPVSVFKVVFLPLSSFIQVPSRHLMEKGYTHKRPHKHLLDPRGTGLRCGDTLCHISQTACSGCELLSSRIEVLDTARSHSKCNMFLYQGSQSNHKLKLTMTILQCNLGTEDDTVWSV